MASKSIVFEIMIHRLGVESSVAALLQMRLRQDGIRAGLADSSALETTKDRRSARYSLCLITSPFSEKDLAGAPHNRFDFIFTIPNAEMGVGNVIGCSSYRVLVDRIARNREGLLINAAGLRRMTRASYDAIAPQFTEVWFDTLPGEAIETFLEYLPLGATILDAGCGPGHHARFFKKAGFDPVGLDFSRSMLDIAAKKNDHILFTYGDILSHTLPKACFDGVWSAVMLNHIPAEDIPLALKNLVATLKWGGLIGLNFQIGRPSEIVSRESDHRFFEYPMDENYIICFLEALGVNVVAKHFGTTTRNTHNLSLDMHFATIVGRKMGFV